MPFIIYGLCDKEHQVALVFPVWFGLLLFMFLFGRVTDSCVVYCHQPFLEYLLDDIIITIGMLIEPE